MPTYCEDLALQSPTRRPGFLKASSGGNSIAVSPTPPSLDNSTAQQQHSHGSEPQRAPHHFIGHEANQLRRASNCIANRPCAWRTALVYQQCIGHRSENPSILPLGKGISYRPCAKRTACGGLAARPPHPLGHRTLTGGTLAEFPQRPPQTRACLRPASLRRCNAVAPCGRDRKHVLSASSQHQRRAP